MNLYRDYTQARMEQRANERKQRQDERNELLNVVREFTLFGPKRKRRSMTE